MKTAISIPDEIFDSADALAEEMGVSRSQLYATAVAEFVAKPAVHDIIDQHPYPNGIGSNWAVFFEVYDLLAP